MEKWRLYSLRKGGTKDSVYLINTKHKRFLFGSSEYCTVRIYIEGIFPKHCALTIEGEEKAYLEPLHSSAITLVNGVKIKQKVCLFDNDVITLSVKEFQFAYPSNSLNSRMFIERPYLKQMKPIWNLKASNLGKNLETSCSFGESHVPDMNYSKKLICVINNDILKKFPEYLLKCVCHELVNISYEKNNHQEVNSAFSIKSLMKYVNQYEEESFESRRNSALKLFEFVSFIRGMLTSDEENRFDLLKILQSIWKFSIARASKDVLFLPLKYLYLNYLHKVKITVHKKTLQARILSSTSKNSQNCLDTISKQKNQSITPAEVIVSSDSAYQCNLNEQKQNQHSSKEISSYRKRVSLAVKRYHLRRRKTMIIKSDECEENLELSDERKHKKDKCIENNADEQDAIINLKEQKTTRTKKRQGYLKKEKEGLQDESKKKIKQEDSIEVMKDALEKQSISSEPTKKKERNKKKLAKKGKENIPELKDDSSGDCITIPKLSKLKQTQDKQCSKNKVTGLKQESEKKSVDYSAGSQQLTSAKLSETKATKRTYKRKRKEASTNETAVLKDKMEAKFTHDSPRKLNNPSESGESKSKNGNYKKGKEICLERTDQPIPKKCTQKFNTQEKPQRITRSMAKSRC